MPMNNHETPEENVTLPPLGIKKNDNLSPQDPDQIKKKAKLTFILSGIIGTLLLALLITSITIGAIELNKPTPSNVTHALHYDDGRSGLYDKEMIRLSENGEAINPFLLTKGEHYNGFFVEDISPIKEEAISLIFPTLEYENETSPLYFILGTTAQEKGNGLLKDSLIERVYFPSPILKIGDYSFENSPSLKEIHFTDGYRSQDGFCIGKYAFSHAEKLENITLPNSLTSLEEHAFEYCTSLTSLSFSVSIESIGREAFAYSGIETIYYEGTSTSWNLIKKDDAWNVNSSLTSIVCQDKTINIQ